MAAASSSEGQAGDEFPPRLSAILDLLEDTGYAGPCADAGVLEAACAQGVGSVHYRQLCCDTAQALGAVAGQSCCLALSDEDPAGDAFVIDLLGFLKDYGGARSSSCLFRPHHDHSITNTTITNTTTQQRNSNTTTTQERKNDNGHSNSHFCYHSCPCDKPYVFTLPGNTSPARCRYCESAEEY